MKGSQADPPCPPQKTELWTQLTMTRNGFLGGSVTQDSSKLKSTKIRSSLCYRKTETGQIHTISIYASIYTGCIHTHTHIYIYLCVLSFEIFGVLGPSQAPTTTHAFPWNLIDLCSPPEPLQLFSRNSSPSQQIGLTGGSLDGLIFVDHRGHRYVMIHSQ